MNILFCYRNWLNPIQGGVPRVCDTLAKYFVSNGHNVYYLNFEYDDKDNYTFPAKIYHLPDSDFFSYVNLDYYHKLLNQLSIDIVINHDASNDRSKLWLNTGKHPAKRISLYHTDPLNGLNRTTDLSGRFRVFIFKTFPLAIHYLKLFKKKREICFLLKNSDKLVLLSDEFKKQILKELNINSSKIEAFNNPCVSYNNEGSYFKKKQILFVAILEMSPKRPDKILQIWSRLQNKFPDWELLFLGDGPDRIKVKEMAKLLGLINVRFEGFVDPVPYYKEASIICMTSDYEGFPLVLPEAMQFGVVPITFNNWTSLKDIVINQETGILIPTDDMSDYTAKLEQLLSNPALRKRISSGAREYSKRFYIEEIGPRWFQLFNDLFTNKV
jgi:glycosyltransferase involved in cell wall biosynthesis